jgi:aromatic ring-opening dioxygenase catalytic subunit (LigB family)
VGCDPSGLWRHVADCTLPLPVTDYGDENPLLYDYFGFQPEMYKLKFKSRGDAALSQRIVQLFKEVTSTPVSHVLPPLTDWGVRCNP